MSDTEKIPAENTAQAGDNTQKESGRQGAEAKTPLPKVDFSTFVLSIASSAMVYLGEVPNPDTGKSETDFAIAQHNIDLLEMLQEKIANGLAPEETRLLEGLLYELRMKYILKSN